MKTSTDPIKELAAALSLPVVDLRRNDAKEQDIEALMAEHLPAWAIGRINGELVLGAHLATKDGRRMGNAHIIHIRQASWDPKVTLYVVLTDAGNLIVLTADELAGAFYPPEFISDLWDVIKKFWRDDISYADWLQQQ